MSRTHELKTWPTFFDAIDSGEKTFEVRLNDRDFAVGDTLVLCEFDPTPAWPGRSAKGYTGRRLTRIVTYVMQGGKFGVDPRWCVLGIKASDQ